MPRQIDLRSDTVTRPTPAMWEAIANAEVGDDVHGEDPTVNALEARVVDMFGKEAAVFVPSGTMGNLISLLSLGEPGDEVICERQSHVFAYEVASAAAVGGLQFNVIDGEHGVVTADAIAPLIRPQTLHNPRTRIISVENTHNRGGGRVFPLEELRRIRDLARERGLSVHLDGARLSHAVVASGHTFSDYAECADTVSMCFSKGLGSPVGSIVASTADLIDRARRRRKQLGGGMRQAGVLAAAAMYALDNNIDRLSEDHEKAGRLAAVIEGIDGLSLAAPVETNIILFRVDPAVHGPVASMVDRLGELGVRCGPFGPDVIRMVTHIDVSHDDIDRAGEALRQAAG